MNIAQLLSRAAQVHADRPAVSVGERVVLRYGELLSRAARLAWSLREQLGLSPGDRVALVLDNRAEYLEILYAAWHAGLVAVPVNAKLHPREVAFILENAGARVCFAGDGLATALEALRTGSPGATRVIECGTAEYRRLCTVDAAPAALTRQPDDPAWLFYTSGTTGRPKGVTITHRNLLSMTLCYFAAVDSIAPQDCIVHAAPMSHGSGMYNFPHVLAGANQVIPDSGHFDPAEIFELCGRWRGVTLFAAPTMVHRLVREARSRAPALDGLKTVVYGGGPMYLQDILDALSVMGPRFAQIYGQGESPMTITALAKHHVNDRSHPRFEARLASVGVAQPAVEVIIADGEDRPLPAGEAGEVLVRGDPVMPGYWQNPVASAETLRNGWLHTGDVGTLDADGFLTLMDRSKDLIISGGTNIYPREVEEALLLHPAVSEVSVVGGPHPEWGEQVVAFVVARGEAVSAAELDAHCLTHIARFKRPRTYRFVTELPKNAYGKVLKTELRRRLGEGGTDPAGPDA